MRRRRALATALALVVLGSACEAPTGSQEGQQWERRERKRDRTPKTPTFNEPTKPLPPLGQALPRFGYGSEECGQSLRNGNVGYLRVSTAPGPQTYYIELRRDANSLVGGAVAVALRAGDTATIDVPICQQPSETYYLYYSAGSQWYGHQYRFGPKGAYSRGDRKFEFRQGTGWEVSLILQSGGNLGTSGVPYEDFIR